MDTPSNSRKEINFNIKDVLSIVSFLVVFVIVWQIVFWLEIWPPVSLPSPAMVAQAFVDLVSENILMRVLQLHCGDYSLDL